MHIRKQQSRNTIIVTTEYGERVDLRTFYKVLAMNLSESEMDGWSLEFSNEDVKEYCFEEYIGAPCGGQK